MSITLVKGRKSKKSSFEGPSAVQGAIKELVDHRSSSTDELSRRSTQMKSLVEISYILRALTIRARTGKITQADLDATTPPRVKPIAPRGTEEAYEYIKTTLQLLRPLIVNLYVENKSLTKRVAEMEVELSAGQASLSSVIGEVKPSTMSLSALSTVLGDMGFCDSEEDTPDD